MMHKVVIVCLVFFITILDITTSNSLGPDPWDYMKVDTSPGDTNNDINVPPDLRIPLKKKPQSFGHMGNGEWFFKRALAIILNGGQTKMNEDGTIDITLQMQMDPERWQTLNEYTKSSLSLNEDMFRRAIAYVEEAIFRPTVTEKIAMAWSEYVHTFIITNKMYIVSCFGALAAVGLIYWLCKHMSYKHVVILIMISLYFYEVIISYKEAERQELDRFMSAVNKCSWYFWKSSCEVSPPDPIIFMKHMNPMKIGLRMFTTLLSEPMITLSATVNAMVLEITDKMWFPFDIILRSILIICINIMLIALLIMIIFNYILNIPFNLSILGLGSIQVKQRKRSLNLNTSNSNSHHIENSERISGATLDRILDVFSRALDNSKNTPKVALNEIGNHVPKLKRSSSTGRLPNCSLENYTHSSPEASAVRKRNFPAFMIGGGDSKNQGRGEGEYKGKRRVL